MTTRKPPAGGGREWKKRLARRTWRIAKVTYEVDCGPSWGAVYPVTITFEKGAAPCPES
jgi:hypothetical protein